MHKVHERLPLDLLPAFEAAARNLSFTKAGQELFLTQSAVSRQIQALEERLGFALFERRTRSLLLTEKGQALYRVAVEVLERLRDTAERLQAAAQTRQVTVTTTAGFAALWLIPRLAGFTRRNSDVDVRISATADILNLGRSGIDLAIRYAAREKVSDGIKLFAEEVFPVCSPALLRDRKRPLVTPEDLQHHALLYFDDPRGVLLEWGVWFDAHGMRDFVPKRTLHFSQYDQLIQAAINGHGVALGRSPLVRRLIRDGQLAAPFKKTIVSPRAYFIVESPMAKHKPEVQDFVSWVFKEAQADAKSMRASKESESRRG